MGASDSWTASSDQEMNFFVLFALAGAAVALPSSRNGDKVVPDALACTKGTSLGDNLKTAFFTDCAPATMRKLKRGCSCPAATTSATAMTSSPGTLRPIMLTILAC